MKNRLTTWFRTGIVFLGGLIGVCCAAADARAAWDVTFTWHPGAEPSAVGTCVAGQPCAFTALFTGTPPPGNRTYIWKFKDCGPGGGPACPTTEHAEWTFPSPDQNNQVRLEVRISKYGKVWTRSDLLPVPVSDTTFTVKILPTTGCTVMAGDGGVDAAEPNGNGIVCDGATPADDPLCAEQFHPDAIAALKVAPEAGYAFTGWIVNGAHIKLTSAEPLRLTTMPTLAGPATHVPDGGVAETQPGCPQLSLKLVKPDNSGDLVDKEIINLNDDDDDGGGLEHGEAVHHTDADDPDGVDGGDDDLVELQVTIVDPGATIQHYRLDYDETFLRVWTTRNKNEEGEEFIGSNDTVLDLLQTSVYVEGVQPHGNTEGSPAARRRGRRSRCAFWMRTTARSRSGRLTWWWRSRFSRCLAWEPAARKSFKRTSKANRWTSARRTCRPPVLKGKKHGQTSYDSVGTCIQADACHQFARIALATEGSVVVYDGHSNYGLGPALTDDLGGLEDFLNIGRADPDPANHALGSYTAIDLGHLRHEHPNWCNNWMISEWRSTKPILNHRPIRPGFVMWHITTLSGY